MYAWIQEYTEIHKWKGLDGKGGREIGNHGIKKNLNEPRAEAQNRREQNNTKSMMSGDLKYLSVFILYPPYTRSVFALLSVHQLSISFIQGSFC